MEENSRLVDTATGQNIPKSNVVYISYNNKQYPFDYLSIALYKQLHTRYPFNFSGKLNTDHIIGQYSQSSKALIQQQYDQHYNCHTTLNYKVFCENLAKKYYHLVINKRTSETAKKEMVTIMYCILLLVLVAFIGILPKVYLLAIFIGLSFMLIDCAITFLIPTWADKAKQATASGILNPLCKTLTRIWQICRDPSKCENLEQDSFAQELKLIREYVADIHLLIKYYPQINYDANKLTQHLRCFTDSDLSIIYQDTQLLPPEIISLPAVALLQEALQARFPDIN